MSIPIRISDIEYQAAKKAAKLEHRSIQGQFEYWARLGRVVSENPDLPLPMIKELLATDWQDLDDATEFKFD